MRSPAFFRPASWLAGLFLLAGPGLSAAAQPPVDPARQQKAQNFLDYASAVRTEILRPQDCPFDPAAAVLRIGTDPDKLAAFVHDHITYEPYSGVVRGADGTLACGSGGDWDRALLMRALLSEAGYSATLKILPRSKTESVAIVDAFLQRDPRLKALGELPDPDLGKMPPPPPLLARFNIPAGNRLIHRQQAAIGWRENMLASLDAADAEVPVIRRALSATKMGATFDQWKAPLLAGASQRVVVILKTPDGQRAFSIGPDAAAPTQAALDAAEPVDDVPPEQIATVAFRLTMQPPGDGVEPVVVLERTLALGSLFRTPIRLEIVPADAKAAAQSPTKWTREQWFNYVSGFKEFQALLHVGHDVTASKVFDLTGQLHDVSSDGRIAGASAMGGGITGGFGGALGGDGDEAKPAPTIDAMVLDIELHLPGEAKPITSQRLIYGKLRPGAMPVWSADILPACGPVNATTTAWLALDAVTADAPLVAAQLRGGGQTALDSGVAHSPEFIRMPSLLYDWQLGRLALAGRILLKQPSLTALGGPAIILHSEQLTCDEKAKQVGFRSGMDLVLDCQRILPQTPDACPAAISANQTLGVAGTILESVLLNRDDTTAAARGPFAASQEALLNGEMPAGRLPGAASGKAAPQAEWAIARNERDRALVFPSDQAARTWWAIDPLTGATIGRGDGGEGQSAIEYLTVTKMNLSNLKCCLSFMQSFVGGDPAGYSAMACISGLDNPGNYVGGIGNVADAYEITVCGGLLGKVGDCLGGAWDATH